MSYNDFNYEPFTAAYDNGGFTAQAESSKLAAPTNVNIHPGYTSVSANWNAVKGADQYIVTITGDDGISIPQHSSTNNIYIDSGLDHGTKYKISIKAINGGVQGLATLDSFDTLEAPPSPSPATVPVDMCTSCVDDDSCTSCAGKPFCAQEECQTCDPTGVITTDSDCYQYKYICVGEDSGVQCEKCNTLDETKAAQMCQRGYGDDYSCNMDTGKCEQAEVSPSSKSSTNWGLIIGLIIGILVAVMLVGLSIFLLTRKNSPSGTEWPEGL